MVFQSQLIKRSQFERLLNHGLSIEARLDVRLEPIHSWRPATCYPECGRERPQDSGGNGSSLLLTHLWPNQRLCSPDDLVLVLLGRLVRPYDPLFQLLSPFFHGFLEFRKQILLPLLLVLFGVVCGKKGRLRHASAFRGHAVLLHLCLGMVEALGPCGVCCGGSEVAVTYSCKQLFVFLGELSHAGNGG